MSSFNKEQSGGAGGEWMALCTEIATEFTPKEEEFLSSDLKSSSEQHKAAFQELLNGLEMASFRSHLYLGVDTLVELMATATPEQKAHIEAFLDKFNLKKNADASSQEGKKDHSSCQTIEEIARLCLATQYWQKAIGIFTLLALWDHENPHYWFQRSLALFFAEIPDDAIGAISLALALNPEQPEYHLLHCALMLAKKKKEEAHKDFDAAETLIEKHGLILDPIWNEWMTSLKGHLQSKN